MRLPTVAAKNFLITIGDRSVGGMTHRDQMVGKYQTPVADCAVTMMGFNTYRGEAMSMGEKPTVALFDAPASGRMCVGEAITNIAAVNIGDIGNIKLSANWMAACGNEGEDEKLYRTVEAVSKACQALDLSIPVGKDSLSMKTVWQDGEEKKSVVSPLSLIISAFAPVQDVRKTVTPELKNTADSVLLAVDLGFGKARMGGSALSQVYNDMAGEAPDIEAGRLKAFFIFRRPLYRCGLRHSIFHQKCNQRIYFIFSFSNRHGQSLIGKFIVLHRDTVALCDTDVSESGLNGRLDMVACADSAAFVVTVIAA